MPLILGICLGESSLNAAEAQNGLDLPGLLQKGLYEEEVNRNLPAAVAAYQKVTGQPEKSPVYGVTAMFRLADCQRKLGQTNEARLLYQRIVQEFPHQTNLVQMSQGRLGMPVKLTNQPATKTALWTTWVSPMFGEEEKEMERLEALLKNRPEVIHERTNGATPLHLAVAKGHLKLAEYLLDHGTDIECRTEASDTGFPKAAAGSTPLIIAAGSGHKAMLDLLLKRGADVAAVDDDGETALHMATRRGLKLVAQTLIQAKVPLHACNKKADTALRVAINEENLPMIDLLCEAGALTGETNKYGMAPLFVALIKKSAPVVERLLHHRADPNLAYPGDYSLPVYPQNNWTISRPTPLIWAIGLHREDLVKSLVEYGANVNSTDAQGVSPLYWAVTGLQTNIVAFLLWHRADPNLANPNGNVAPLYVAAQRGDRAIADMLLEHKADVNIQTKSGQTSLHAATRHGGYAKNSNAIDAVVLLLEQGANVNLADKSGITPLDLATRPSDGKVTPPQELIPDQSKLEELKNILVRHGARILPHPSDRITVCSVANMQKYMVVRRDTNGWNDFTLMEIISMSYARTPMPVFPDWEKIRILRHGAGGKTQEFQVNLAEVFARGSKDVPLEWGDLVDIPQKAHGTNENWPGLAPNELMAFNRVLEHRITVEANGMTNQVKWVPFGIAFKNPDQNPLSGSFNSAWLAEFLKERKELLYADTSVLTNITVIRTNVLDGRPQEILVDALIRNGKLPANNLWLRDGDVVTIPRKQDLTRRDVYIIPERQNTISVGRNSTNRPTFTLRNGTDGPNRSTNEWNHYTLLEAVALTYLGSVPMGTFPFNLDHPDWERVRIIRTDEGGKIREILVDMGKILRGFANDMPLKWGDGIDIPVRNHPANEPWESLSAYEVQRFNELLKRRVIVETWGNTNQVILEPFPPKEERKNGGQYGFSMDTNPARLRLNDYWQIAKLHAPKGDLSRITIIRTDPATGQRMEVLVDALRGSTGNWIWLRDGDILRFSDRTR